MDAVGRDAQAFILRDKMRQSGVQIRSPKFTGFVWNTKREEAALHVAHDRLTDEAIAKVAGISKRTLEKWKLLPEFRIRVYAEVS